ncbi:hypothetical protein KCU72_g17, partial [Aureobasidium melanogenum]
MSAKCSVSFNANFIRPVTNGKSSEMSRHQIFIFVYPPTSPRFQQLGLWSSGSGFDSQLLHFLSLRCLSGICMYFTAQATVLLDDRFAWRRRGHLSRGCRPYQQRCFQKRVILRRIEKRSYKKRTPGLQALRVPIILDLASSSRNAGCRASPTLTTTLTPVGSSTTARARRSSRVAGLEVTAAAEVLTGTLDETAEVAGLDETAAAEVADGGVVDVGKDARVGGGVTARQGHLIRCGR